MDEQHLADHYEDVVITRDINYANTKRGLDITLEFIEKHNLILIGGMAIDLSLKAKGLDGIYRDDKLPDYDFVSPDAIKHSSLLGAALCKVGLPTVSVINAIHTTTRKVRVNFVSVADIGYCPQSVFDKLPYIEHNSMRIIHPHFQMMDIHHALSFPFENPTRPVVSHRWRRDMKRYDLLFDAYPIKSKLDVPKMTERALPKSLLSHSCITGWAALSFWRNKKIAAPEGEPVHILDDDFGRWVAASTSKPVYISSRFGKMPRSVLVTIDGSSVEVFDNLGEKVSAERVGSMYVANLQHVMMLFLVKKYLQPESMMGKFYDAAYVECIKMVQSKNAPPGITPSISVYGRAVWSEAYIINRREFAAKLNNIKLIRPDRPKNIYPTKPACKTAVTFDYKESIYFDISGAQTDPFVPKRLEYFGTSDLITMDTEKKKGGADAKRAWVTLLMIGTQYVPGAITMAHSLRKVNTAADIVCMVTPDIKEDVRAQLRVVFDHVIEVQYIEKRAQPLKSEKQNKMYGGWMSKSCTKWQCLALSQYDKIIFIDADQLVLKNNDELFDLPAPAGTFSTPWIAPFVKSPVKNPYGQLAHGDPVRESSMRKALKIGSVVSMASLVILEPSERIYNAYMEFLEGIKVVGAGTRTISSSDEVALAQFTFQMKMKWVNIHQRFQAVPSKPNWLEGDTPRSYHYIGRKPWDSSPNEWDDVRVWWEITNDLIKSEPSLKSVFYSEKEAGIAADLTEYRIMMDVHSIISGKIKNKMHRRELNNIMEKWLITMANTETKRTWSHIFHTTKITDAASAKMIGELVEKGIFSEKQATSVVSQMISIINARLTIVPRDIDTTARCIGGDLLYGSQYNKRISFELKKLLKSASCSDVVRLSMRYDAIMSGGQQWAMPKAHIDHLYDKWNVRGEGFASPFNSRLMGKDGARFCSLFPDLETQFGSAGSFFNTPLTGNWVVNPPFIESIMVRAFRRIVAQLESHEEKQVFFVIMPAWRDSPAYTVLHESKYNMDELFLRRGRYNYESGSGKPIHTRADSIYFAMSNMGDIDFAPTLSTILSKKKAAVGGEDPTYMIRIIRPNYDSGVKTDALVLQRYFESIGVRAQIVVHKKDARPMKPVFMQFFIERLFTPQFEKIYPAAWQFIVINHEYTSDWIFDAAKAGRLNVLCKTRTAVEMIKPIVGRYISFTGMTEPHENKHDNNLVLHMAGTSPAKGTMHLLEAWMAANTTGATLFITAAKTYALGLFYKHWESLKPKKTTFRFNGVVIDDVENVGNIYVSGRWIDDNDARDLMRTASIWAVPSVVEGWGHVINSAMMHQGVLLLTDGKPMNELTRNAIMIPSKEAQSVRDYFPKGYTKYLPAGYDVHIWKSSKADITKAIETAIAMPREERVSMGRAAQNDAKKTAAAFSAAMKSVIQWPSGQSRLTGKYTTYEVGEAQFDKEEKELAEYDQTYKLTAQENDAFMSAELKKGILYEKYVTMAIHAFARPNSIVLDIGANIGCVAIPTGRIPSVTVLAFEAFGETYDLLRANIDANKTNVIAYNAAVGHTNGMTSMSDFVDNPIHEGKIQVDKERVIVSGGNPVHYGNIHLGSGAQKVPMITIDTLGLNNVSVIKVDIEGAEPLAFFGMQKTIRRCKPVIIFEANENVVSSDMAKATGASKRVASFDILEFCWRVGYRNIVELHVQDYMLIPPGRQGKSAFRFVRTNAFRNYPRRITKPYKKFRFVKPSWT
jgi:FkbM family methyltransferase